MDPSERNGWSISLVPHFARILRNSIRDLFDALSTSETIDDNSNGWKKWWSLLAAEKMHLYDCKYLSKEVRKAGETDARTPMSHRSILDMFSVVHGSDWRNRYVSKEENPAPCRIIKESIVLAGSLSGISGADSEYGHQKTLPSWEQNALNAELSRPLEPFARMIRIWACEDARLINLISIKVILFRWMNINSISKYWGSVLSRYPP